MANEFLTKRCKKFTYDVAVHGGTKNTSIVIGQLPAGVLVTDGWGIVRTTPVGATTTLSAGVTGAVAAIYPATTATTLATATNNGVIKLLPGVLNVGAAEALTTVDTPAEIVAIGRVTGDTVAKVYSATVTNVLVALSNDNDLTAGKIDFYLEYYVLT